MRKIIEYRTIMACGTEYFDKAVVTALSQGWELYGHPYCYQDEYDRFHALAMVKYECVHEIVRFGNESTGYFQCVKCEAVNKNRNDLDNQPCNR